MVPYHSRYTPRETVPDGASCGIGSTFLVTEQMSKVTDCDPRQVNFVNENAADLLVKKVPSEVSTCCV